MPAAIGPGPWGTADHPLFMSPVGWDRLHPMLRPRMDHVHLYFGEPDELACVKNQFGELCRGGESVPAETWRTW